MTEDEQAAAALNRVRISFADGVRKVCARLDAIEAKGVAAQLGAAIVGGFAHVHRRLDVIEAKRPAARQQAGARQAGRKPRGK